MSIFDRISGGVRSLIYGPDPDLSRRDSAGALILGGPRQSAVWPNYDIDGQMSRAYRLAVVVACIDAIARDVSAAPLRVYRDDDGQPQEEPKHPARVVIREPNPGMSESEFWFYVVSMAAATGFCVIEKVRSGAGRPVELWPLVSPWIKVKPQSQAMPDWEYRVPGNDPWLLKAEDVIVVTYRPDMYAGFTGRSPLSSLRRELAIDDQITDFLNVLLERGGVPPLGLKARPQGEGKTIPKFSQAEADMYTDQFAQKYGGTRNWGKPVFLGGFEVEKIGLDLGEMLFPDVREYIELHVCTAFGVPAGMIGTAAGLARNTYSNAETDVAKYYSGTISPLWSRLDGAFTRGLLREYDPAGTLEMDFDVSDVAALQDDEEPRWQHSVQALSAGLITLNQAQSEVGLPGFGANGEVLYLPFSATPTKPGDLLAEAEPKPVPPALAPFTGDATQEPDTEPESDDQDDEDTRGLRLNTRQRADLHTRSKKTIHQLTRKGAPLLRAFWRKQGERIAAAVAASDERWDAIPEREKVAMRRLSLDERATRALEDVDWDAEEAELGKVLNRFYALNGEMAFAAASDLLKVDVAWDLSHPNIRQLMNSLGYRIRGIAETTRQDVSRTIVEALDEGVSLPDLASRIETMFTQTYASRAMTVSRTESMYAYGRSSATAYQQSGVVSAIECLDNPDHTEHYEGAIDLLSCSERNGTVSPLDMAEVHLESEHINGTLAIAPVLTLGED